MGYYELLNWLVDRRAMGDDSYYTVPQICKALRQQGHSDNDVGGNCIKLEYEGYVEAKMSMDIRRWLRMYRATNKAVRGRHG